MTNREYYELLLRSKDGIITVTAFGKDGGKQIFRCSSAEEIEEVVSAHLEGYNTYIYPNLRRTDLPPGLRGGDEDVTVVNCLTADVDIRGPAHTEQKLPETTGDALKPLEGFPPPTLLINSGYGVYGVWVFKEPIPIVIDADREKVERVFSGFGKAVMQAYEAAGYKIDNVFNISHLFRVPGSRNNKLDSPAECRILENSGIFYTLEDFAAYRDTALQQEKIPFEADERVVGSADRIMDGCLFCRKMLDDPNAVTEPEWKAQGSNIVLAADGAEKFHEYSSLYNGYSTDETDYKIRRCLEAKKPCTCRYIREKLGFPCPEGGCGVKAPVVFALLSKKEQLDVVLQKERISVGEVYDPYLLRLAAYAKNSLPAEYGKMKLKIREIGVSLRDFERAVRAEAEAMAEPEFEIEPTEINLEGLQTPGAMEPQGYRISIEEGVNSICYENGVGFPVNLCHEPVVISRRLENIDTGRERLVLSHYRNHRWKEIVAPRSVVFNRNKLVNLSDNGLPVSTDNAEGLVRYLTAYEMQNSKVIPFVRSINRIGWVGNEFYPCAVKNDYVYEGEDADHLVSAITESGDYDLWLRTATELRKNPFARAIMAASFASPLLELLQHRVIILHVWHSSRSGKTAALKFALSIWGDPMKLMGNFNSTAVGLERKAGTLKHLPLGLDELQVLNEKRLSPSLIVYSLGNGYGKTRGSRNGGLQDVPTWRNCIISTGEQPLSAENAMDGVDSRVLELYGPPTADAGQGRIIHQISESNYGFAGKRYIEYLIENILTNKETLRQNYETIREKLQTGFEGDPGAHLDNIAVLALADCYASVSLWGIAIEDAFAESVSLGDTVLKNAKSLEKEDVVERAWHFLIDWVATNKTRFETTITPCYGKIEPGKVYIIAAVLRQALEDEGFSYTKSIRGFRERGYIEVFSNAEGRENTQCQKKIQGINVRAVCLRLDVQTDADEFLA